MEEGRIRLTNSPILQEIKIKPDWEGCGNDGMRIFLSGEVRRIPINPKKLDNIIANYIPDAVLLKCPTPGAEYNNLISFYIKFLSKSTLIISDEELKILIYV